MSTERFLTFQKFNDRMAAAELTAFLEENNIEYLLDEDSTAIGLGNTFGSSELSREFRVKLQKDDFLKVDQLLQENTKTQLENIDRSYYLFDFTDEELLEIIVKRDEWGHFDFLLAQKLLKERGKEVNGDLVALLRKQRITDLSKQETLPIAWIYAGYIASLFGGILGFMIGWHLSSHKKTMPNGELVNAFSVRDRELGKQMMIFGGICLVIWVIIQIVFIRPIF